MLAGFVDDERVDVVDALVCLLWNGLFCFDSRSTHVHFRFVIFITPTHTSYSYTTFALSKNACTNTAITHWNALYIIMFIDYGNSTSLLHGWRICRVSNC